MSRFNFDALVSEHRANERTLRSLEDWLNKHQEKTIYLAELVRDVPADSAELADVLTLLVNEGILRRVYKVIAPSGVLTDEEFDDPTRIPARLPDRWEHYFDTAESDVMPVFKMSAK